MKLDEFYAGKLQALPEEPLLKRWSLHFGLLTEQKQKRRYRYSSS